MQTYHYAQARELIKDGDIIFFKNKPNISSKLIEAITDSPFSHVAIAFWVEVACKNIHKTKRLMIVEATGHTNNRDIVNLSNECIYDMIVLSPPLKWIDISENALDRVGLVPYGWTDGALIGIQSLIYRGFGKKINIGGGRGEYCSEFVAKAYKLPNTEITPHELYDTLISQYKCEVRFEIVPLSTDIIV
jgi:hypothetical protein